LSLIKPGDDIVPADDPRGGSLDALSAPIDEHSALGRYFRLGAEKLEVLEEVAPDRRAGFAFPYRLVWRGPVMVTIG
jgi:hypothetical protein